MLPLWMLVAGATLVGAVLNSSEPESSIPKRRTRRKPARAIRPGAAAKKRPLRVFLCHSSSDKPAVRRLYRRLQSCSGVQPWLDEKRLLPGEDWEHHVTTAVQESDAIVVCLSQDSIAKEGFIQKEMRLVLNVAREKPDGALFLIPARLEDCEIPRKFRNWQWVDLFSRGGYNSLLAALRKRGADLGLRVGAPDRAGMAD